MPRYLDAGAQASPEMIGTHEATLLSTGSVKAFERHRDTLRLLSTARFVGQAPEAAAVRDLALFGVWYDAQLGVLRAMDVTRRAGVPEAPADRADGRRPDRVLLPHAGSLRPRRTQGRSVPRR